MPTGDRDTRDGPRTLLALLVSPFFGGICGAVCGFASGGAFVAPFAFIFGAIVGLLCFPFLADFYKRGHTFNESLLAVLAPAAITALAGGLMHVVLGLIFSVPVYAMCAQLVDFPGADLRTRFPNGHCQSCGYNLAGLSRVRCPECGAEST